MRRQESAGFQATAAAASGRKGVRDESWTDPEATGKLADRLSLSLNSRRKLDEKKMQQAMVMHCRYYDRGKRGGFFFVRPLLPSSRSCLPPAYTTP